MFACLSGMSETVNQASAQWCLLSSVWLIGLDGQRVLCFNQVPEKCTWCHNIPVIDSIYCLIKLFSLFSSLTVIIILRGFFEQLKH